MAAWDGKTCQLASTESLPMRWDQPTLLRVTCAPYVPPILGGEVEALGYTVDAVYDSFLDIRGTLTDAMRLNLHLRTAFAVLYYLHDFPCAGPDDLYEGVYGFPWERMIPCDE